MCVLRVFARFMRNPSIRPTGFHPASLLAACPKKCPSAREVFDDLYGRGQFTPPAGYAPGDISQLLEDRIAYAQKNRALKEELIR